MAAICTSVVTDSRMDGLGAEAALAYIRLACLAAEGGDLSNPSTLAGAMRMGPLAAARTLVALADAGLIAEDGQGRMRLARGGGMSQSTSSHESGKSDIHPAAPAATKAPPAATNVPQAGGNVAALPVDRCPSRTGAARTRRWRQRKAAEGQQLHLALFGRIEGGRPPARHRRIDGGVMPDKPSPPGDVTAGKPSPPGDVTAGKPSPPGDVTAGKRHTPASPSGKHEENQAQSVTLGPVTPLERSYIYSSKDLLEEKIDTTVLPRDAGRRHRRRAQTFPPAVQTVIDHCHARYPPRKGDNPKKKAGEALAAVWQHGDDPQAIIAAFERWRRSDHVLECQGTQWIPQLATWCGDRRFDQWMVQSPAPARQDAAEAIRAPPPVDPAAASDPRWTALAERLSGEIGPEVWASWFSRLVPAGVEHDRLRIAAPTRFLAAYIESNFGGRLQTAARAVYGAERVVVEAGPEAQRARGVAGGGAMRARGPP